MIPLKTPLESPRDPPGHVILRATVGSKAHGLAVGDDDSDEMGVTIEPMEKMFGGFEQFIYRSAALREGRHDAPSQPGDLDLTVYGLHKYIRLALKGNPSILTLLYVTPLSVTRAGMELQFLSPSIISRRAGYAFLGYMQAQRQRLAGERGGRHGSRKIGPAGYDTKYAGHIIRLGIQGIELLRSGRMILPMRGYGRALILNIRNGSIDLSDVLTRAGELERELKDLCDTSPLPSEPDTPRVEAWMIAKYREAWKL